VGETVAALTRRLTAAGVPSPRVDAELLVRHVLGWSRAALLTRAGEPLPRPVATSLDELGARRAAREPLQLLLGVVGFRRLELAVRPGVFIPRPETEVLAGEAAARTPAGGVVVEVCTGGGAVACAVAHESEARLVIATDASADAVALARENAARCGLGVTVLHGHLLEPLPGRLRGGVDVLVSNPPYVAAGELAGLEPEVRDWEPVTALVAGPTGHELSDALIAAAPAWLRTGGWLLLEVDSSRAPDVARRCLSAGLTDATIVPDLTGRDRVVLARAGPGAARSGWPPGQDGSAD
jgi:release factor glutamine methyltransferase